MSNPLSPVQLTADQRKILATQRNHSIDVSLFEIEIIKRLREIEFGSLIVTIEHGYPFKTEKKHIQMLNPKGFI